ncbi:hypothetical protein ACOZ4I_17350 (plasmid) [Haloarcula salina]|uniref:hypothetical protein n=1 Tax=Haloarcula salina TaxID=1429914 RepID=UPI003C6EB78F
MAASDEEIECALAFELSRNHAWAQAVDVDDLVGDSNVLDEQRGRDVARDALPEREFIGYHPGKDQLWLKIPPADALAQFLRDNCGYGELQIEATLDSHFDGF